MEKTKKNKTRTALVWHFAKPYFWLFVIAEICILVSYAVSLLLPLNLSFLTDRVLYLKNPHYFPSVIRNYIILFSVSIVFNIIYAIVWQTLYNRYVVDVKNKMFEKIMNAKPAVLSGMNSGDLMSRIDYDADQFIYVISRNLFHFANSIILCVAILCVVASINFTMAVILFFSSAIPIFFTWLNTSLTAKYAKRSRTLLGIFTGRIFEVLKGFRELKLLCAKWWAEKDIFKSFKKMIYLHNKIKKLDFAVEKGTHFFNLATSLIVYGVSAILMLKGQFTIGFFLAVVEYILLLHKKFNWMLRIYLDWHARKVSIDRVNEVFDMPEESQEGALLDEQSGTITFKSVTFGYDENLILNDVSFEINEGEKTAIVGMSGVGKSTIVGLMLKFFEPQNGRVLIGGQDVQDISYESIRNRIGVVQQDILIFEETVRYNLTLDHDYSSPDEKLLDVCEKAGLKEVILNLPSGLDTVIGKSHKDLSGGQKQRIMLARILLSGAKIVVLDEASSALDAETETAVFDSFSEIKDITMVVISHRRNTIENCNKIIVLDGAKVENAGTHNELLEKSAVYRRLFEEEKMYEN